MKEFLKGLQLFEELSDPEIEAVSDLIEIMNVRAGEIIIRQEQPVGTLFLLRSGTAKVVLADDSGGEEVLAVIPEGEAIGELALIDHHAPSATVVAEDDVVLYAIRNDELRDLMKGNLSIGCKVLWSLSQTLVRRLRDTDQSLSFARMLMKFQRG